MTEPEQVPDAVGHPGRVVDTQRRRAKPRHVAVGQDEGRQPRRQPTAVEPLSGDVGWEPSFVGKVHPTQAVPSLVRAKAGAGRL